MMLFGDAKKMTESIVKTIPFPQRDVHLYRQDTAGRRDGE
jgi:hypothetical protein